MYASVVEWSITTDCKSVGFGLRRFKSFPTHKNNEPKAKALGDLFFVAVGKDLKAGGAKPVAAATAAEAGSRVSTSDGEWKTCDQILSPTHTIIQHKPNY